MNNSKRKYIRTIPIIVTSYGCMINPDDVPASFLIWLEEIPFLTITQADYDSDFLQLNPRDTVRVIALMTTSDKWKVEVL